MSLPVNTPPLHPRDLDLYLDQIRGKRLHEGFAPLQTWIQLHYIERILSSRADVYPEATHTALSPDTLARNPGEPCIWNTSLLLKSEEYAVS